MATLFLREYARQGRDSRGGLLPCGEEPALANQAIPLSGTSAASAALNVATTFVQFAPDSPCCVAIGASPTAVVTEDRLPSGSVTFRAFQPNSGLKIAAILTT